LAYQSEAQLEELLVQKLERQGYSRIKINNETELLDNFKEQFSRINKENLSGTTLTDKEWERIFNVLEGKSVFESAKVLRDKICIQREDGSNVYLQLFTPEVSKNIYQVTNQVTIEGKYKNRYDVTLLINGLPLVQIELKRRGLDMKKALNQIERYRRHSFHGLYRYIQIFIISNGVDTKYISNTDREKLLYSHTFFWTDENNVRITNLHDFSTAFLDRYHLTKMIDKYMVLNDTEKLLMVMRPYQVYAAEALISKALNTSKNAFVWHTTGSGKTLTSFKVAQLLATEAKIKKIFFVVDRKDLDSQTADEFNKFEPGSVDQTTSTNVLVKQIKDKNRRLIVTTLQKMARAITNPKYENILKDYENEKVVFIIDECHRSQFGEMHKAIVKHFKKAQFFGFTGTPRRKENMSQDGRTTADLFGECVHTYLIKEAIHDNNVLGFNVEYVQTFEGQYDEADMTMVEDIDTEEVYMADDRISMIANHIINIHYTKTRNRIYTALFATQSIPALIKYYDEFKTIKHDLNIAAIFSFGTNEDLKGKDEHSRDSMERIIEDYNDMFGTNFSTHTFSAYHKDISKRFKTGQIDILIVVNMFLTGFDSKYLSTLYVDKELKYHDLLQAYSRTNRVESDRKPFGNIVCYRNLKKNTDESIRYFSMTDDIDEVLMKDYDFYVGKFNETANQLRKVAPTPESIDTMESEEDQKEFVIVFRELSRLLLILQTFIEFSFDKSKITLDEQTYEDYKSKYHLIYDNVRRNEKTKVSILNDIDFQIELIETNKINVAYILNLVRSIEYSDEEQKEKDIQNILKELARTDDPVLRRKVDLIKAFLEEVLPQLKSGNEVDEAYNNFEDISRMEEIKKFAEKTNIDENFLKEQISEYEFTGIITKGVIRRGINKPLPLVQKVKLTEEIVDFIKDLVEKYQQ
jgi:type I restriction enzyme R subunit